MQQNTVQSFRCISLSLHLPVCLSLSVVVGMKMTPWLHAACRNERLKALKHLCSFKTNRLCDRKKKHNDRFKSPQFLCLDEVFFVVLKFADKTWFPVTLEVESNWRTKVFFCCGGGSDVISTSLWDLCVDFFKKLALMLEDRVVGERRAAPDEDIWMN